jgi:hypothetical protein
MRRTFTLLTIGIFVLTTSCHRYYTSSSFEEKTSKHRTIAVLPPQIVMTGKKPRDLSEYDIAKIEETESKLFQRSLYNNILTRANTRKYVMDVSVQPYDNTIALLETNGVSIRDAWRKSDAELSKMLGVDAIVRMSVQKERYMSDLASFGIDMGARVLNAVIPTGPFIPGMSKTNDIIASCALVSNGETLWNDNYKRAADWNSPANSIIENITDKFAKHFPYKKKA